MDNAEILATLAAPDTGRRLKQPKTNEQHRPHKNGADTCVPEEYVILKGNVVALLSLDHVINSIPYLR